MKKKMTFYKTKKILCRFLFISFFIFMVIPCTQAETKVENLPKEAIKAMYLAQQALQGQNV